MRNITIGQYINTNSWLHKVDPRIKMSGLIILLVCIFLIPIPTWNVSNRTHDLIMMGALMGMFMGSLVMTASAKIPLMKVLNGLKGVVFLLTFTFVIQILTNQDGYVIASSPMYISVSSILLIILIIFLYQWSKKYIKLRTLYFFLAVFLVFYVQSLPPLYVLSKYQLIIADKALIMSLFLLFRIATIIILTSLLTFTTMATDLNFGIESLLKPLKWIGVPIEIFSMMLSLTLRAIPTLLSETEKIMKAQASRGADFSESKLKDKLVQIVSLLIPIFGISIKRAADMSNAMEVRGYIIGGKRTRIDQFKLSRRDYITLLMAFILLALFIYMKVSL